MMPIFRQLYDQVSSTYTYFLADPKTLEAVVIDLVFELHHRDLALVKELGLRLKYVLDTHCHADHVTGAWLFKQATGAQIVLSKRYGAEGVDLPVDEGDQIRFGGEHLDVRATPGHTAGCLTYVMADRRMAFTGDCLMIRSAGRTDFQQGNARRMFASIHKQLFTLPDACLIYPAHDYDGRCVSTVREEKLYNTRIGGAASETDFVGLMENLGLAHPKKIDIALPANMRCGKPEDGIYSEVAVWGPVEKTYDGVLQISADWVATHLDRVTLIDVREPGELTDANGVIKGARNIPIGRLALMAHEISKEKPVVTVCQSGKRSAQATVILQKHGFQDVANLKDGMIAWLGLSLPSLSAAPR
jgi:glyoxylase-like metal-dependent hydrolase (beta-lactamase superfamily II)/rhodanese-related sulfurtransferase